MANMRVSAHNLEARHFRYVESGTSVWIEVVGKGVEVDLFFGDSCKLEDVLAKLKNDRRHLEAARAARELAEEEG